MQTVIESRSSMQADSLQEIIDASVSAKHATLGYGQQYTTPEHIAKFLATLLPSRYVPVFDPQCANGNLVTSVCPYNYGRFGFEIDNRFESKTDGITRIIGNCVKIWKAFDDLYPDLKFPCQVANPPFGIRWKLDNGTTVDSTEYTWRQIIGRAPLNGCGYFIANYKTIEHLKIDQHPWVYLYQKFPAGLWKNCDVEIGVVHWINGGRPDKRTLIYSTLDYSEHGDEAYSVRHFFERSSESPECNRSEMMEAWNTVRTVMDEERVKRPPYNIWLNEKGMLKTYLSTRIQIQRKLTREDVLRISKVNDCHPLSLTTDRETRKLLNELVTCGLYQIEPKAKQAIDDALKEVAELACPILPVTLFELTAYADEQDVLVCKASGGLPYTPGKKYELTTATYSFTEKFQRDKVHYDEQNQRTYTSKHECSLSGQDRYIQIKDDHGNFRRFMDKPTKGNAYQHEESMLWSIFEKPVVGTVADVAPDKVKKNLEILKTCEMLADYTYYPGQLNYVASIAVKDNALVAAQVGTGKSLFALSLIQLKAPNRALIIAPQGTMRSGEYEEDESMEYQASQWVEEIRRFTPSMPVFQLFSLDDYEKLKRLNNGELPPGIYISYPQAMFYNQSRVSVPEAWDDKRLSLETGFPLPEYPDEAVGDEKYWCKSIGLEVDGIRCIVTPCLSALVKHEFDMVLVDEAHLFCHLSATSTQMLIRMQPRYRYALTATPIPDNIGNLFSLMGWLTVPEWFRGDRRNAAWPHARNEQGRFEDTFRSTERDFTQEEMKRKADRNWKGKCEKLSPVISSPARLLKIIKPTLAFISKKECNPNYREPTIIDVRVPMGKEQSLLYAHFLNRGNISGSPLTRARKQTTYLRNICADPAGFTHGGPKVSSNMNPKTMAVMELAAEIIRKGDPLTIISCRVGQTDTFARLFNEVGIDFARIDSTTPADEHSHQSNLFKSHKRQVMLMGMKCAAAYSFSECPWEIVASLEYSPGPYEQARGRVDRVNSKYPVTIYTVLHKFSYEETMHDNVATKDDAAKICLLGRRIPRTFKPVDLGEVLANAINNYRDESVAESECENNWLELRRKFK